MLSNTWTKINNLEIAMNTELSNEGITDAIQFIDIFPSYYFDEEVSSNVIPLDSNCKIFSYQGIISRHMLKKTRGNTLKNFMEIPLRQMTVKQDTIDTLITLIYKNMKGDIMCAKMNKN